MMVTAHSSQAIAVLVLWPSDLASLNTHHETSQKLFLSLPIRGKLSVTCREFFAAGFFLSAVLLFCRAVLLHGLVCGGGGAAD